MQAWLIICPSHCKLLRCQHVGANKLSRHLPHISVECELMSVLISSDCTWSPESHQLMSPLPLLPRPRKVPQRLEVSQCVPENLDTVKGHEDLD